MDEEETERFAEEIKKKAFEVSWVDVVTYKATIIAKDIDEAEEKWLDGDYGGANEAESDYEDGSLEIIEQE